MKQQSVFAAGRILMPFLLILAVTATTAGCWGSRGFPGNGQLRVRIINEGYENVTDITVTHGEENLYASVLEPGRRMTQVWRRVDQDEKIIVSYFHPKVGSERKEYMFRARDQDAGYTEIRFDREGALDMRTRFRVTADK
jgi:hypothetical protein